MNRIAQLDGLRFFAVLSVMIGHWLQWEWTNPILRSIPFSHGVTLFFVLSGFLITGILIKAKENVNANYKKLRAVLLNFYARRFLRIFPIYYLLIFLLTFLNFENVSELLPYLLSYTSNIYIGLTKDTIGNFTHLWTLAVEEQFYLVWPFVILFTKASNFKKILLVLFSFSILFKIISYYTFGNWYAASYSTIGCMNSLILGALLAHIRIFYPKLIGKISGPIIVNAAFIFYLLSSLYFGQFKSEFFSTIIDESFFALVATLIVLRASKGEFKGPLKFILENKFVQFIGRISYGMYLYHVFVRLLFYYLNDNFLGLSFSNKYLHFAVNYSLTLVASVISWYLIELPINKMKTKFPYVSS